MGYVSAQRVGPGAVPPTASGPARTGHLRRPAALPDFQLQSQFELTLDAKNRLTIPAKFREPFKAGLALVKSFDVPAVGIEPAEEYAAFVAASLKDRHPTHPNTRRIERWLNSAALPGDLDGQGRITIPAAFLAHAKITGNEVLLVGSGRRFELWDRQGWENYAPELESAMLDIASEIGDQPFPFDPGTSS